MTKLLPAPDALVGKRLDMALSKMLGMSRAKASELIADGRVRVLDRTVTKSSTLLSGDLIELDQPDPVDEVEPVADDMPVVYEDEDVIVVDKPVGVAAHPSVGWTGPTVLGSLLQRGTHITSMGAQGRQGIVSRLDAGTSGLMLVCKSDLAYKEIRRQFADHEVVKIYHALVQGNLVQGHNRGADRSGQGIGLPLHGHSGWQGGHNPLGRDGAIRLHDTGQRQPGDRPHPPDSCSFLLNRAPPCGGPHVWGQS